MASTTNFSVRMDSNSKSSVWLDQPNKETIAAILEAEQIAHDPDAKRYSDVEEALRELKR